MTEVSGRGDVRSQQLPTHVQTNTYRAKDVRFCSSVKELYSTQQCTVDTETLTYCHCTQRKATQWSVFSAVHVKVRAKCPCCCANTHHASYGGVYQWQYMAARHNCGQGQTANSGCHANTCAAAPICRCVKGRGFVNARPYFFRVHCILRYLRICGLTYATNFPQQDKEENISA
jgi:hypothetical protein